MELKLIEELILYNGAQNKKTMFKNKLLRKAYRQNKISIKILYL